MNTQKGNVMVIGLVVGVVLVSGLGYGIYQNNQKEMIKKNDAMIKQEESKKMMEGQDDKMMKKDDPMMENKDTMMEKKDSMMEKKDSMMKTSYTGKVLAGKNAQYLEFNTEDYEKAKADGKIVFLDFYATWCPVCRAEAPVINEGFNELDSDKVVGFRVNYKDNETSDAEKALAKEFEITYQHTKVILKDGKEVLKTQDTWDKETFSTELQNVLK